MTFEQGEQIIAHLVTLLTFAGNLETALVAAVEALRWLFLALLGVLFFTIVRALRR